MPGDVSADEVALVDQGIDPHEKVGIGAELLADPTLGGDDADFAPRPIRGHMDHDVGGDDLVDRLR